MALDNNLPDEITIEQITEYGLENICYQNITRGKWLLKANFNSTSFFIDKNFLLTSAHNLVRTYRKANWANISPSRLGSVYNFGKFKMPLKGNKSFRIFPDYEMKNTSTRSLYDIALLYISDNVLESNTKFNNQNFLPLLEDISSIRVGEEVYCAGYPASGKHKNRFRMTLDASKITQIKEHSIVHNLDTATGNSGSPIMVKRNDKFYVIGVNSIGNNGTLVNQIKQNWIEESKRSLKS